MVARKSIDHPLLQGLYQADKEARRKFPTKYDKGLGGLGLILFEELEPDYYEGYSPTNAWTFATTGGDGVHFSLLATGKSIDSDSPIAITIPAAMGQNFVVGENLFDFLCLGVHRGFFALEQLAYDRSATLQAYTDRTWESTKVLHRSVGFDVDEHKRCLLEFLVARFKLTPWSDIGRFEELQRRFKDSIVLAPDLPF